MNTITIKYLFGGSVVLLVLMFFMNNAEQQKRLQNDPQNPGNVVSVHVVGVAPGEEFYVPILRPGRFDIGDNEYPTKPIVNHGNGWFYFPYEHVRLLKALVWFKEKRPDLECVGELGDIASTQSRETGDTLPNPPGKFGGHFMKFRPRLAK